MKLKIFALLVIFIASSCLINAQGFSIEAYKDFLKKYENMTSEQMYELYPVGLFNKTVRYQSNDVNYFDSINTKYDLTDFEKQLIDKHGFMVSERLSYPSFWDAYRDIWYKDLPVFISTDAILHALHMSYDAILKDLEVSIIIPKLDTVLRKFHDYLPVLKEKYSSNQMMQQSLNDYDVYFTIALKLLQGYGIEPKFQENTKTVDEIMELISSLGATTYPLFSYTCKWLDFSQFTVRGHYTDSEKLGRYFKSMMWLGRTEFYLIAPQTIDCIPTFEDVQRQIIDVALIYNASEELNLSKPINDIDKIIKSLVGESDNVQLPHIGELIDETGYLDASEFSDSNKVIIFQEILATKPYSEQKILSQILFGGPFSVGEIKPASSFLLFGQRFIIDSYVFSNVVYDKVLSRMLPSSLDVLFALGNNGAGDLLKPELDMYRYSLNLSGLRYLIDSYSPDFWKQSFYNGWLNTIRTLNAPSISDRGKYPEFMQTAAWWQEKMNTQLASWAQLRHDNLLYAKQSYTGGIGCSNPDAYLEPIPEFYKSIYDLAIISSERLIEILNEGYWDEKKIKVKDYFENLKNVMDTLYSIASKELANEILTEKEYDFMRSIYGIYIVDWGCGTTTEPSGWFASLFFNESQDAEKQDFVVADVHTAPTDENGEPVGWVKHVGTGPINLVVITVKNNEGNLTSFVGPVMSYYEYTSTNFKRLTDEEWKESINELPANRPFFVNLYLADSNGQSREINPVSLPVGVDDGDVTFTKQLSFSNYPNPFTNSTLINFILPQNDNVYNVNVDVFDINGKLINNVFKGTIPSGNYMSKWNGTNMKGARVNPGVYLYVINLNGENYSGKMLMK
ncbi:MAG: DUF3160 domain-containing protein [Bacteroidetes bacterium]|nr:MAG: DUF3160 domain-containing protein [Bacteroidota bacterium]